jgi:hypothetical protein
MKNDPFAGPCMLGTVNPGPTAHTEFVVSKGQAAIPLLMEAMRSSQPRKVGDAAYCLNRLEAYGGAAAAKEALAVLERKESRSDDERSAMAGLEDYLARCGRAASKPAGEN